MSGLIVRRFISLFAVFCITILLGGCDLIAPQTDHYVLRGTTMGTSYSIKALESEGKINKEQLYLDIKAALDEATGTFSNWEEDSALSRFNKSPSTRWQEISPAFAQVMAEASSIHHLSGGAFDVTLAPLIDLWGFGPNDDETLPTDLQIREALKQVGQSDLLEVRPAKDGQSAALRKRKGTVTVNLSAIAKGYGADLIARSLEKHGFENYLVEIGGDLLTRGVNEQGEPWRVGVEKPDALGRSVQLIVPVRDMGLATSGDYRNYIEKDGKRLSHILDPKTGRPVTHDLASVTILAKSGMRADGLATALLVLGEEAGRKLATEHGIAAYFIRRTADGFVTSSSPAFDALMEKN